MKHDWQASIERLAATFLGETPDRVPLGFLASEDIAARISGLSIREMLASPEKLAVRSVGNGHQARVAGHAPRRFRGNAGPVFQL